MNPIFGALAPKVDKRDYMIAAGASQLPDSYTIPYLPPVKNQKNVSSCVAHAAAVITEYFHKMETNKEYIDYSYLSLNEDTNLKVVPNTVEIFINSMELIIPILILITGTIF